MTRTDSKKAAARKTYAAKRASAKAKYRYAIAGYQLTKTSTTIADNRTFSLSAAV